MPWTDRNVPDQRGRVAVITGGNAGIGFEVAAVLARSGASVALAVRDLEKGKAAAARLAEVAPAAEVSVHHLDLSSLTSVRAAAGELRRAFPRLDLLINNAGVMYNPHQITEDGFELQFGTNHLGHFALTGLLLDRLLAAPGSRVVTVSSAGHRLGGPIDLDDPHWRLRPYDRTAAYGHSKLANLLFTYELQRRLHGRTAIAVAAHPGGADTGGSRTAMSWSSTPTRAAFALVRPFLLQSPAMGALPVLRAATDPGVRGGEYYGPRGLQQSKGYPKRVRSSARSYDEALQRRLWTLSAELTGVSYEDLP